MNDQKLFDYQGVFVGAIQAAITGILICGAVGALAWWFAVAIGPLIIGSFFVGALWGWIGFLSNWRRALFSVYDVEEIQPVEILDPEPQAVRVIAWSDDSTRGDIFDLPVTAEQLQAFAVGVLSGASLAINHWASSDYFSRSEYELFRSALIQRGLASDHGSNKGLQLRPAGRACMRYFAQEIDL